MITLLSVKGGTKMFQKIKSKTLPIVLMAFLSTSFVAAQREPLDTGDLRLNPSTQSLRSQAQRTTAPTSVRGAFGEDSGTNDLRGCVKPKGKFLFNIEKGQLSEMVAQISQLTCKSFIIASTVSATSQVTVMSRTPIDVDEAWAVFLSALAVNNIGLVQTGKYYKLVKQLDTAKSPIPVYERGDTLPNDEGMITMVYDVKSITPDNALAFIRAFSADSRAMKIGDSSVAFSDSALNVKRVLKILEKADAAGGKGQIYFIELNYAKASEIQASLDDVFGAPGRSASNYPMPSPQYRRPGQFQPNQKETSSYQKIIADDRTNRLIIISSESVYKKIKEIVEELDIERTNASSQSQIYVYKLENGDAEKMATTLNTLLTGVKPATQAQGAPGRPVSFQPISDNVLFESDIKVTHDKANNALVVVATPRDYNALKKVIEKLDKERVQIYIEAAIMDISITDNTQLGLEFYSGIQVPIPGLAAGGLGLLANAGGVGLATTVINEVGKGISAGSQNAGALAIPSFVGTFGLMGLGSIPLPGGGKASIPSVGFLIKALQRSSNIDILSTPSVMALDNEEAYLQVGRRIPQISGATSTGTGGTTGLGVQLQNVTYQDAFLKFKITPHVNALDKVQLVIDQDISEVGNPLQLGDSNYFEITNKTAKTTVVAKDQETVVIGGLINEANSLSETKTPILGDIPIIGNLFKTTVKDKFKKNLVLVLTPHIIRSSQDLKNILDKKMQEREDIANLYFGDKITKYNPKIDFDKKRGPLAQLLSEVEMQMRKAENGGSGLDGEILISPAHDRDSAHRKVRKIDFDVPASSEDGDDGYYFEPQFMAPPNLRGGVGQPSPDFQQNEFVQPLPEPLPAVPPTENIPQDNGSFQPDSGNMEINTVPVQPQ